MHYKSIAIISLHRKLIKKSNSKKSTFHINAQSTNYSNVTVICHPLIKIYIYHIKMKKIMLQNYINV